MERLFPGGTAPDDRRERRDTLPLPGAAAKAPHLAGGIKTGRAARLALCCYFRLSLSMYPAVMIPAGKATTAIPKIEESMVIILPAVEIGYMSP